VVRSSGRRYRGSVRVDGGCGGRDAGNQLGGMRHRYVMEPGDQGVQTATGAASVVHSSAALCTIICAAGRSAAASMAGVVTAGPDVEQRLPALGRLHGRGLGAALTAARQELAR
jgi:hypothetical protein